MEYLVNYFWPCLAFLWACYLWEAYLGYRQVRLSCTWKYFVLVSRARLISFFFNVGNFPHPHLKRKSESGFLDLTFTMVITTRGVYTRRLQQFQLNLKTVWTKRPLANQDFIRLTVVPLVFIMESIHSVK